MSRTAATSAPAPIAPSYDLRVIPIEQIRHNTVNPRRAIDPVKQAELEKSVAAKGIETPIGVRPIHDGLYEIIRGERRVRAAETVGLATIPALVQTMTDDEAFESAVVENLQRADMNLMDEAEAYVKMQKAGKTPATISARTGVPESRVFKLLKYTTLEKEFTKALAEDRLTQGHADRLVRLTPADRKRVLERDLVWRQSPLFRGSEKAWVPTKDDLVPLHELDHFIQERTTFDPNADDLQHFQPELAAARDTAIEALDEADTENAGVVATIIPLSADSLVRMKTGLEKNLPLSPSKWKAVKPGSCEHAQLGAIVHGGPARVLTVCVKKSCTKHWPVAKKKAAAKTSTSTKTETPQESSWERENRERAAARAKWEAIWPRVRVAVREHLAKQKLKVNVALIRLVANGEGLCAIGDIEETFDVTLTERTIPLVLALSTISSYSREGFLMSVKPWKFDLKAFEKQLDAEAKKAAQAHAKSAKKGAAA